MPEKEFFSLSEPVKSNQNVTSNGSPRLSPKHTGKVVIRDKLGIERVAVGVHFSNLDLGWYDCNSEPHPLFEKYQGCQFSLRFRITDLDQFGKTRIYENLFLSPFRLGEMGPTDWRHIPEAERLEAELAIKFGAFNRLDDPGLKHLLTASSAAFVAFTGVGMTLKDLEPFIVFTSFAYYYDDQVDNNRVLAQQFSFHEISEVTQKLIEVLRGERKPEEQKVKFDFPHLITLCRYLEHLRKGLKEGAANDEIFNRFVTDMVTYLNVVALGTSSEWMTRMADPSKAGIAQRTHSGLRQKDAAGLSTFEALLLSNRRRLSREIYEGHLWTQFRQFGATHLTLVNDVLSYKKEMEDGETCNIVYGRSIFEGKNFVEAMDSCVEDVNNAVKDINELEKLMLELYNNDEELKKAAYLVKACMMGHMMWYNYALRYHNGVVFDCVV